MLSCSCSYFCIVVTIADGLLLDLRENKPFIRCQVYIHKMTHIYTVIETLFIAKNVIHSLQKLRTKKGFGPTF